MNMRRDPKSARGLMAAGLALLLILFLVLPPALTSASERKPFVRTGNTQQRTGNDNGRKVAPIPPQRGTPFLNLPNLDEVRQGRQPEPVIPAPIQSTLQSRRKSGNSIQWNKSHHRRLRNGARVNLRNRTATQPAPPQSGPPPFTDDPLKDPTNDPESYKVKAVHITELRTAINIVRNRHHLADYVWQKPLASTGAINTNVLISWEPIDEMRTALNQAIGAPPNGYAANLGLGLPVLATHIQELRERVKDILGSSSINDQLVPARVDLLNQSGDQLEARDCEWSLPLVSLPGRAGLDLGIGLTYSSMVWTQAGSHISFDDDRGDPSPGFRLGFPIIQGAYNDNIVGRSVYLFITAAGQRVELRRVGTTNIYEAGDSSYLQLIDYGTSLRLRTTDGTQMSYGRFGTDWHCTSIEDRNGNLIVANYDAFGDLTDVTDTLGRLIRFVYDANTNLSCITQGWNGQPAPTTCGGAHTWATFGWGTKTIQPAFSSSLNLVGIESGETIPVLTQVGLPDGSHYNFEYNPSGQVTYIRRYSDDYPFGTTDGDVQRTYTRYEYDTPSADCPRITAAHVWASNWNGDTDATPATNEEVTTWFTDNHDGSHQMTAPDATIYKEVYGGPSDLPAWQHGLVTSSQVLIGSTPQKTTTIQYTQDNTTVNYQMNPRVYQTVVSDGTNSRKTTIDYQTLTVPVTGSICSLPNDVSEFDANQSTVLRHTYSHYKPDTTYLDNTPRGNRIIGLVDEADVYQGTTTLVSKITYAYDGTAVTSQATTAAGHDINYDAGVTVRGNVTSVSHWDVSGSSATTTSMTYDAAGSILTISDPLGHTNQIEYVDKFSTDGVNLDSPRSFATFAYPTSVTDADQFSSSVWYNYDFSGKMRIQGPPPGNPGQYQNGIIQTFSYDNAIRLKQLTTVNTGAYVHYDYGPYYTSSFASVNNVAANYWESDTYTNRYFDGLGRLFAVSSNHPNSTGGNRGQYIVYDQMGRAAQQTNPFEMDSTWHPTGDDAAGYRFNVPNTFDWKGRPLRIYSMNDGYDSFKTFEYTGFGCAGGEVVTLTDEGTILSDGTIKVRQQKVYSDVLGRQWKTEVLNWDGPGQYGTGGSVYSTSINVFNARDQVTVANQYSGSAPSDASSINEDVSCPTGTCQKTTMDYDGYGRLRTKHVPEQQDANGNPTYTTWTYYNDDTVNTVTDARGAVTTYGYNGRHQVRTVSDVLSGYSTINVGYDYDAAGNRTSMTHSIGGVAKDSATYAYDSLSRMSSETRHIVALESGSNFGDYTITYGYTVSGELASVSDPFGTATTLTYDSAGRTFSVTGNYGSANYTYASNIGYRAWGAVKAATFGGSSETVSYNSRMQPAQYRGPAGQLDYSYFDDGRLKQLHDLDDWVGDPHTGQQWHYMSRVYSYDQSARLSSVGAMPNGVRAPFTGNYGYDAFDNMNSRSGQYALNSSQFDSSTFTNNRRNGWSYNPDGQVTYSTDYSDSGGSSTRNWTYDAAGELITTSEVRNSQTTTNTLAYDGDGELIYESVNPGSSDYLIRSAVLGTVVNRLTGNGGKDITYVPANGLVAPMHYENTGSSPYLSIVHRDASGLQESGAAIDPFGNWVQNVQPLINGGPPGYTPTGGPPYGFNPDPHFLNANNLAAGCNYQGTPMDCNSAMIARMGLEWASNLPGFYLDNAVGEKEYNGDVRDAFAPKPKGPPTLKKPGRKKTRAEIEKLRRKNASVGNNEELLPQKDMTRGIVLGRGPRSLGNDVQGVCSLLVEFQGKGFMQANGPGSSTIAGAEPTWGLGFTVSGAVEEGGIGVFESEADPATGKAIPDIVNPQGTWTVQQLVSFSGRSTRDNYSGVIYSGQPTGPDAANKKYRQVDGNAFVYADHPGPRKYTDNGNLIWNTSEWDFDIKVIRGSQDCEVKFHVSMTYENGDFFAVWRGVP